MKKLNRWHNTFVLFRHNQVIPDYVPHDDFPNDEVLQHAEDNSDVSGTKKIEIYIIYKIS